MSCLGLQEPALVGGLSLARVARESKQPRGSTLVSGTSLHFLGPL